MIRATFAVPGALDTPTGGYAYARALLAHGPAAGLDLTPLALPAGFPAPDAAALAQAARLLAAAPADRPLLVDGLALGAMPAAALTGLRAPLAALIHHPLCLETGLDAALADALRAGEAAALRHARAIVAASPETAAQVVALLGAPADRVTVARPGLDRPPRSEGSAPPLVLTVAAFTPRKDHATLLSALERLPDLPWRALWLGADALDAAWTATLRARLAASPVAARVAMRGPGNRAAVAAAYRAADLFALPSRHEGYGMVYAEAMAAGLPVVAADIAATRALIPPAAGRLVPPGDAAALARALRALLGDPAARRRAGRAALMAAKGFAGWDATAAAVAAALAPLTAR